INVSGDLTVEPDEGFTVTLSNPSDNSTFTTASADGKIGREAKRLGISATEATKAEGDSGTTVFRFTVTRTGDTSGVTTVDYAVTGSGANAADADDFGGALPSGTVTFGVGETSQTISINVSGDLTVEPDEGFTVTLSNPSDNSTFTTDSADG